ncbi:GFA family protein [Paraburkholderia ferrariae]|uniref:GFA family protein n=1 Tax=Paraburkholderia ferrariae TaxID=386056 RepID=UPI0004806E5B|nr:GFA family protein [Paraburkholderia ferrariae]
MTNATDYPIEGGCDCRFVRYRLLCAPLFVHCCHCRWCQRESGASFALNAMIESERLELLGGAPMLVDTPSQSGRGQKIARCPTCSVALWSHYAGAGPVLSFVRVGTLDNPDRLPPDIHIFTASRQPWVVLPETTPAVPEYYDREQYWPPESLARRRALLPRIEAWQAAQRSGR